MVSVFGLIAVFALVVMGAIVLGALRDSNIAMSATLPSIVVAIFITAIIGMVMLLYIKSIACPVL